LFAERRIEVIPHGLDLTRFRPINRRQAREWLGLPINKKLVLYSAVKGINNPYKGFKYIEPILDHLSIMGWKERMEMVVLGSSQQGSSQELSLPSHYLGHLHDEMSLAMVYGAADLLLAPSMRETLGLSIIEAIACGTPSIAFKVGGIPDLIDHKSNGYLVEKFDIQEFSYGIDWILRNEERYSRLSQYARKKAVQEFDIVDQAKTYIRLYKELMENPNL
jgi:glycosyltransferase involved in cell wall biosynthesis